MPGATLPNMSIVLPALGGDSGEWDDLLNEALGVIDEHDHTSGSGKLITTAALDIDADLTIAGYALTSVGKVAFSAVTALASGSKTLFVSSSDNELYWRSNAGTNVKLTSGTSINTSLVGGIVGDYTSVGAEVAYDDANDRYTFKQEGGSKPWARLASGDVRIYEYNTTESVYVGLKAPSALASSYEVTWPLAVPGSTSLMQMDSSGVVSASNTVANAVTFSAATTCSTSITTPTIAGTPNFTGAVTMASTLGVTGLITATAGLTAAANQHVAVSGTGRHTHGNRRKLIDMLPVGVTAGSVSFGTDGDGATGAIGTSGSTFYVPLSRLFSDNDSLSQIVFKNNNTGGASHTYSVVVIETTGGTPSTADSTSSNGNSVTLTLDPLVLAASYVAYIKVVMGAAACTFIGADITWSRV